jgi:[ribosomal protein S5]-alanine N-acetyltransferase
VISQPMQNLETERTTLRFYRPSDWPEIVRLHNDPDVVKYLVDAAPDTPLYAGMFIKLITEQQALHPGLGIWRVALKKNDAFVGNFSLMPLAGTDDVEIGGRMLKEAWGDGYSMEVGHALLQHAFDNLQLKRVVSMCHPENRAAANALIATGFVHVGAEFHYDRDLPFFVFERERWYQQFAMDLSWREHARRNLREARWQKRPAKLP